MPTPFTHRFATRLFGAALLAGGLVGCGDEATLSSAPVEAIPSFEDFRATVFQEPESGIYIVDGDIPILDEEGLEDWYLTHVAGLLPDTGEHEHERAEHADGPIGEAHNALLIRRIGDRDDRWGPGPVELTYCVSTAFGPVYQTMVDGMADAIEAWRIGDLVSFRHVAGEDGRCDASNPRVTFDVRPIVTDAYLARAFFPSSPRWARNILVTPGAYADGYGEFVAIMEHELGHTLGFRHEHIRDEAAHGCHREDRNWRPVTAYDRDSVMHYPWCGGTELTGVTPTDRKGLYTIYGNPIGERAAVYETRWCGGEHQVRVGDFNGDGREDLLCHDPIRGRHWIDLSWGGGALHGTDSYRGAAFCSHEGAELHLGDFNGDRRTDWLCHDSRTGYKWILYADAAGRFDGRAWRRDARWCSHDGARLHVGDINGDGRDDMLCHDDNGNLWIDYADRSGRFYGTNWSRAARWCGHQGARLRLEDFDGDGRSDLFCRDDNGTMWLDFASRSGRFEGTNWDRRTHWCTHRGARVHLADLNGDGRTDLLCHDENTGSIWVDLVDDGGRPASQNLYRRGELCVMNGAALSFADLDGDRRQDALCHDAITGDKWVAYSDL